MSLADSGKNIGAVPEAVARGSAQRPDGGRHRFGPALEMRDNVGLPDLSRVATPVGRRIVRVIHWTSEVYEDAESPVYELIAGASEGAKTQS